MGTRSGDVSAGNHAAPSGSLGEVHGSVPRILPLLAAIVACGPTTQSETPPWTPPGGTTGEEPLPPITGLTQNPPGEGGGSDSGGDLGSTGEATGSTSSGSSTGEDVLPELRSGLGIGLAEVADWSSQQPFLDLVKSSRWWSPAGTHDGFDLDTHGWLQSVPLNDEPHLILLSLPEVAQRGALPFTEYVVRYDGAGSISYAFGTALVSSESGRDVIDVSGGQAAIRFVAVDPDDPIRNITVVPTELEEEFDRGAVFNPVWLERLRGLRVIRFMDWMGTNDSTSSEWGERPRVEDASWAQGVPIEVMLQLANELGADPWFNVPHLATDGWVEEFSLEVSSGLDGHLRPYIEHSNEVWNYQFEQAHYAEAEGLAAGLSEQPFDALLLHHAHRSSEVWQLWEDGAGAESFVRVLGSQAGNPWVSQRLVDAALSQGRVDALAIAPYFGNELGAPEREAEIEALTVNDLLGLVESASIPDAVGRMTEHGEIARAHGLSLVAYEGGQHLVGFAGVQNNETVTSLFISANRSPRMRDAYSAAMQGWRDAGGEAFVAFVDVGLPGPWGSWGALEYATQVNSPKWEALSEERERPCWWDGCDSWR